MCYTKIEKGTILVFMSEKLTVTTLKKRLDVLLKVVRYDGTVDGITNYCKTCPIKTPTLIKDLQCGHFIKRGNQSLKYIEENMMPQCRRCNHFLDGAQDKAAYYILHKYGVHELDWLIETDIKWQQGLISPLKKSDFIRYYNHWLVKNRIVEKMWNIKLIPSNWKTY